MNGGACSDAKVIAGLWSTASRSLRRTNALGLPPVSCFAMGGPRLDLSLRLPEPELVVGRAAQRSGPRLLGRFEWGGLCRPAFGAWISAAVCSLPIRRASYVSVEARGA